MTQQKRYQFFGAGLFFGVLLGLIPGFALGVYFLPILTEQAGVSDEIISSAQSSGILSGAFDPMLKGSDALHWGEGTITLSREAGRLYLTLDGRVAPGPDYRLYLSRVPVEDEAEFLAVKDASMQIANINSFTNFRHQVPDYVDISQFNNVVVWCERFSQFITAAPLR